MCRAVISGYVYGFEVVGGMGTSSTPAYIQSFHSFGENKNVVLRLTSELNPKKCKIFFNKLFVSLELLFQLKSMNIYVIRTLSKDLTRGCPLTTGSAMRKDACGTMWFNFLGKDSVSQANRFDSRNGKIIQVPRPGSVVIYNRFVGGVDKADMLLSLYCSKMRKQEIVPPHCWKCAFGFDKFFHSLATDWSYWVFAWFPTRCLSLLTES